jgi:hypothetical protein
MEKGFGTILRPPKPAFTRRAYRPPGLPPDYIVIRAKKK